MSFSRRPFLTAEALGKELNMRPRQIRKLARSGEIPGHKLGTIWRFRLNEVLQETRVDAQAQKEQEPKQSIGFRSVVES